MHLHTRLTVLLAGLYLCPSHLETEHMDVVIVMPKLKFCSLGDAGFQLARRGSGRSLDHSGYVEDHCSLLGGHKKDRYRSAWWAPLVLMFLPLLYDRFILGLLPETRHVTPESKSIASYRSFSYHSASPPHAVFLLLLPSPLHIPALKPGE